MIKLLTYLTDGFKRLSMKLLSLCVSFSGPALCTMGLKFIPSVIVISIKFFHLFYIVPIFPWFCEYLVVNRNCCPFFQIV